jgi:hypothetical protein
VTFCDIFSQSIVMMEKSLLLFFNGLPFLPIFFVFFICTVNQILLIL